MEDFAHPDSFALERSTGTVFECLDQHTLTGGANYFPRILQLGGFVFLSDMIVNHHRDLEPLGRTLLWTASGADLCQLTE